MFAVQHVQQCCNKIIISQFTSPSRLFLSFSTRTLQKFHGISVAHLSSQHLALNRGIKSVQDVKDITQEGLSGRINDSPLVY